MTPGPATFTLAKPADTTAQWAGLDLPAITTQLKKTGVYAPADQAPALQKVVDRADADGHHLHVVVLDQSYSPFTVYRDIATKLQTQVGGTVIVMGPNGRGTASNEFSRVQLEDGTSEAQTMAPAAAAAHIYDRATEPYVNWTVVTILLIVVVVIGAVIARWTTLRARRAAGPAAPPATGSGDSGAGDAEPSAPAGAGDA
ncbi:DUF6676 family protein [Gordonia sp. (in: high G+C Gram-positive bacteria)]|uniref:Rv1476 family membrane protein n=1 Tax=Gordonia sp. (in: high G+C Gram-positive bacteria) TaxID=84139 RepID=UPI0035296123